MCLEPVKPKQADPSKTEVSGLKDFPVNKLASFSVTCKDSEGNPTTGSMPFAKVPRASNVNVADKKGGLYSVEFLPKVVGKAEVHVEVEKKPVTGSPFSVQIVPGTFFPEN